MSLPSKNRKQETEWKALITVNKSWVFQIYLYVKPYNLSALDRNTATCYPRSVNNSKLSTCIQISATIFLIIFYLYQRKDHTGYNWHFAIFFLVLTWRQELWYTREVTCDIHVPEFALDLFRGCMRLPRVLSKLQSLF